MLDQAQPSGYRLAQPRTRPEGGRGDAKKMIEITREAAAVLDREYVLRDLDRSGHPHLLVKVPDLAKTADSELGIEVRRNDDGTVVVSVLLFDIPTEPVTYEMHFSPARPEDLRFLRSLMDSSRFRLHPCAREGKEWKVGGPQTLRLPPNMLLRLKHFSLDWPSIAQAAETHKTDNPQKPVEVQSDPTAPADAADQPSATPEPRAKPTSDPRDTVIKKLKQQVESLRTQLRERDKRIVELEDEVTSLTTKNMRFSDEKKPWWKPF